MITTFSGRTADEVWRKAFTAFQSGVYATHGSRLGEMREILRANFYIDNPRERWIPARVPAINPAFAIAEVLWMLAGSDQANIVNFWNPSLPRFAGAEKSYHGAYGFRIRANFGIDQLERVFRVFQSNPHSRQVVIQIWDAVKDLPDELGTPASTDIPCNVCSMLKVRDGKLEWTQIMRSNDLYRGTPYNIFQFTMLQEIVAGWLGLDLGGYYLLCDSLHIYEKDCAVLKIKPESTYPPNNDRLALSKDKFDATFNVLWKALQSLMDPSVDFKDIFNDLAEGKVPQSYRNLISIVAADAARRRFLKAEMDDAVKQCTNPLLLSLWHSWVSRWDTASRMELKGEAECAAMKEGASLESDGQLA